VRRAATIVLVLVIAGCAPPKYVYERRRATPAQTEHDLQICRRESFRPDRFALWPSNRYDWDAVNRCMGRKGYSVRPDED